jgi:Na+-transporting NADH:ubiquinone oxidoreductase subunit NqrF
MNDTLTMAFIIFGVIDLTLVGTTCIAVILLVRKVMLGKVEIKIADKIVRLDRDFIEKGQ